MAYGTRATFDTLRSIAFGSITGSYQAVGSAVTDHVRILKITNGTDANMLFSTDGTNDNDIIPANGYVLYDFSTNKVRDDGLFLPLGTIFYIKQVTAPGSGSVYITTVYAQGGV